MSPTALPTDELLNESTLLAAFASLLPGTRLCFAVGQLPLPAQTLSAVVQALAPAEKEKLETLGAPGRRDDYLLGRWTEQAARQALNAGDSCRSSLSHSGGVAVAVATPASPGGVGIDLERATREIAPEVIERVSAPSERAFGLTPHQAWTLKEAAVKADPERKGAWMGGFQILAWKPTQAGGGEARLEDSDSRSYIARVVRLGDWVVALAFPAP